MCNHIWSSVGGSKPVTYCSEMGFYGYDSTVIGRVAVSEYNPAYSIRAKIKISSHMICSRNSK